MFRFIFAIMILCSFTILFANTIQINPYTLYNGEINISIDDYHMEKVSIAQNRYDKISIKDFDYTSKIGYPYLPAKYFLVAIPKNSSISIEVDLKDKIVLKNPRRGGEEFDATSIKEVYLISALVGEGEDYYEFVKKNNEWFYHSALEIL